MSEPIQQHDAAVTIRGAALLASAYQATMAGIARRRRDGVPSGDLQQLARALRRAHTEAMSPPRHELASPSPIGACSACEDCALVSVSEAAAFLRLSRRQIQRLAADPRGGLGGVQVGRTWALNRRAVLAFDVKRRRNGK